MNLSAAVVGGGVSGAYLFWRLRNAGYDVTLYEQSDRIGGRLYSVVPDGMPNLHAELGGMRFLDSQQFTYALTQQLGLASEPFPMGGPNNIAYLRDHFLRVSQFTDPSAMPYFLAKGEQGHDPGQILVDAITTLVPDALNYTPQQWEAAKQTLTWKGRKLYDWGFWDAIYSTMSSEAYALLLEGGGYQSLTDNWNAAEACQHLLADFPRNVHYLRLTGGYESLPMAMAPNGTPGVQMGWRLQSIDFGANGGPVQMSFDAGGAQQTVEADFLFLAMPQMPLRTILDASHFGSPQLQNLLSSVTPMPAIKIMMGFSEPWWQQLGVTAGRSTTDLPLRQVYYFGQDPQTGNALLMATYSDGRTESFWRYLSAMPNVQALGTGHIPRPLVSRVAAGTPLQNEVLRQLAIMHGVSEVPQPTWMQFVDWTVPPFGAGWHFWNAGVNVGQQIGQIRHPFPALPIFICGEAYSNEQGWVEGALKSAELTLRGAISSIPIPSWLANIYLGP